MKSNETGSPVGIHVRMTSDLVAAIDRQRLKEQDLGTRPEFIRKLLRRFLVDQPKAKKALA